MTSMRPESGHEQAGQELEQRRLARAVGAEQRDELAGMGRQADAIDGPDRPVGLDHVVEMQRGDGFVSAVPGHRHVLPHADNITARFK